MTSGTPSLTLRSLLARAVAKAGIDRSAPVIAGLTASSKALAIAGQARSRPGVTLVVTPTDIEAERLTADIRFFYGGLEAASDSATEQAVLLLPALQVDPYRGMTPHFRVAAARARALHGAVSGSARIIVASAAALLPRTSPPERLLAAAMELREGTGDRTPAIGGFARGRRFHARGSGRRARRLRNPWRHRGCLSRHGFRTCSLGVRGRHGRDIAAARSGDAAIHGRDRSRPPGARARAIRRWRPAGVHRRFHGCRSRGGALARLRIRRRPPAGNEASRSVGKQLPGSGGERPRRGVAAFRRVHRLGHAGGACRRRAAPGATGARRARRATRGVSAGDGISQSYRRLGGGYPTRARAQRHDRRRYGKRRPCRTHHRTAS